MEVKEAAMATAAVGHRWCGIGEGNVAGEGAGDSGARSSGGTSCLLSP